MRISMSRQLITGLAAALISAPWALAAPEQGGFRPGVLSVYIGGMEVDDQSVRIENSDLSGESELDFSTLPGGGIVVEMPFARGGVEFGMETGAGLAWRNDDTRVAGSSINGSATVRVDIDNSFLLLDYDLGLFTRFRLGGGMSLVAGGGAALVYARHEVEDQQTDPSGASIVILDNDESSDFAPGYYAHVGIDYTGGNGYGFGIGARWLGAELDFDDTLGEADIDGVFYCLTFTQRFD